MNAYVRGVAAIGCALAIVLLSEARAEEPHSSLSTALGQSTVFGSVSTSALFPSSGGAETARIHIGPWGVQVALSQFNQVPAAMHLNGPILNRSIYYVPVTDGLVTSLGGLMRMNPQSARAAIESMFPMPNERIFVGSLGGVGRVNSQVFGGGAGTGLALGYHVRNGAGTQGTFAQMLNRPGGIFRGYELLTYNPGWGSQTSYGGTNSNTSGSLNLQNTINWSGNLAIPSGNPPEIFVGTISGLTSNQLAQIRFFSDGGSSFQGFGTFVGTEVVPTSSTAASSSSLGETTGTLTLANNSLLTLELNSSLSFSSGANVMIAVNGNLTLDGTLNLAGHFNSGAYRLINYTGTLTENGPSIGNLTGSAGTPTDPAIDSTRGQVNLLVSGAVAVPEPATLALGLMAVACALAGWRRRRP